MSETFYTLEDVAKNNGVGDARIWIVMRNVVYDVTDYLNEHPGGGELLMEYAGKDGTSAFDDYGHSSDAKNIVKSYRIGRLAEKDRATNRGTMTNGETIKMKYSKVRNDEARKNRRSFLRGVCGGCI